MKIRMFYFIENGVYGVSVVTEDWSEGDVRLMEKFGEPEINVGGTLSIEVGEDTYEHLTLDDKYVRIRSGSPITRRFDSRDTVHASEFAELWGERIRGAIGTAYSDLHAKQDGFTREVVYTLSVN